MIKQKGLGRGLDALLGGNKESAANQEGELRVLAIDDLKPGKYQPRTRMDKVALDELAASIKQRGIVHCRGTSLARSSNCRPQFSARFGARNCR